MADSAFFRSKPEIVPKSCLKPPHPQAVWRWIGRHVQRDLWPLSPRWRPTGTCPSVRLSSYPLTGLQSTPSGFLGVHPFGLLETSVRAGVWPDSVLGARRDALFWAAHQALSVWLTFGLLPAEAPP